MANTHTQHTLAECKRLGWQAEVTEKWVAFGSPKKAAGAKSEAMQKAGGYRKDLFGFIDVLAFDTPTAGSWQEIPPGTLTSPDTKPFYPVGMLAIQAFGETGFSSHISKLDELEAAREWLRRGNRLEFWSWRKKSNRWAVKRIPIVLSRSTGQVVTIYQEQAEQLARTSAGEAKGGEPK